MATTFASFGVSPAQTYTPEVLELIARTDPERFEQLRQEGHSLTKLKWGPDR